MPDPHGDRAEPSASLRFLAVRVGERRYALRADDVSEVIRVPPMTRVPQSPRALLGIANLRGAVLPVASLRALLGMTEEAVRPTTRAIVLDIGAVVAVVVDAVDALVTVAQGRIETRQAELAAEPGETVNGAFSMGAEEAAVKILDLRTLLDAAFAQRARTRRAPAQPDGSGTLGQVSDKAAISDTLVTFEVAGQEFGLDIASVQEVLPAPAGRTAVPQSEALVLGVTSLRGMLLPLLSLRALLGFPLAQGGVAREKVIVTKVAGAHVGLVADRARAIISAERDLVDPLPAVLSSRVGGESRVRAIYRGDAGRRLISILAPEQLFRDDVMARLSAHREEQDTNPAQSRQEEGKAMDFVVFRLGEDEFALPLDAVDEVAQVPAQITRVPKTPRFLEGVVNLRGKVVPVIDQRRRFDMPRAEQLRRRRLLVVRSDRHRAGLIVDGVSDVLRIPEHSIEAAPDLTEDVARLVRGVINLHQSGRIILLLDPSELLTRTERALLDTFEAESVPANA